MSYLPYTRSLSYVICISYVPLYLKPLIFLMSIIPSLYFKLRLLLKKKNEL